MVTNFPANNTGFRRRSRNTYTCTDRECVVCRYDVVKVGAIFEASAPRNGILLKLGALLTTVIAGTQMSRDMSVIISGGEVKTYTFPSTAVTVGEYAFYKNLILSVKLNEGLKALKRFCFYRSGIRSLILPSIVESIGENAFHNCKRLEYADLSAAHGLKVIGDSAFSSCKVLR